MSSSSDPQSLAEAPLYVRWNPDRSPYAIELRLDLVSQMANELARAEKLDIEVGGVLIGSFAHGKVPALRIDEVEMVPRAPRDGAIYMLDPGQRERLAQLHWSATKQGKAAVGFFRSHGRSGPMKPSLADRSLLSGEFKQAVYVLLLVEAREPRSATFFVAVNGQLPNEPSVGEFRFDEADFKALPEVESDGEAAGSAVEKQSKAARYGMFGVICALLLAAVWMAWSLWTGNGWPPWRQSDSGLALSVAPEGSLLRISWNHSAQQIANARSGRLVISDGPSRQEIRLGPDELKLGAVDYERVSRHVALTMTLDEAGSSPAVQSLDWTL